MVKSVLSRLSVLYFSKKALPYWVVLTIDCLIVILSHLFVNGLLDGTTFTLDRFVLYVVTYLFIMLFYLLGFRIFHTYSGIFRYSSLIDLQRVGLAVLLGLALELLFLQIGVNINNLILPTNTVAIFSAISIVLGMSMVRISAKFIFSLGYMAKQTKNVFIYGVENGGVGIANNLLSNNRGKNLVGFVSDSTDIQCNHLMGLRIYPNDENLVSVMKKRKVEELLVSPLKNEALRANTKMTSALIDAGITIKIFSDSLVWDGKSNLDQTQLKDVDVEDLLPRDKIDIDLKAVESQLKEKVILITGAAGSIGSEIVRQVSKFNPRLLILIDQAETPLHDIRLMMAREYPAINVLTIVCDICVKRRMNVIFETYKPEYVFHAAAYKHVPMMEDNPGESIRNNIKGTKIVADLSVAYGVDKFVMVSTDKAVNPTNVMGCSKRICEIYVQSLDKAIKDGTVSGKTQFVTTRFGNVLGSNGSVIPLFKEQIRRGGPVTVTHPEVIRFFMLIPEACKLVLEAGTMGNGGEIFVFDMGDPVKIIDLAKRMIALSGAKNIEIKITGLRYGEKLYEEVLDAEEKTKPTFHPKIKIAEVREYCYYEACDNIDTLIQNSYEEDEMSIVKRMKEMVPEFKSQNSRYQELDN